jgi:hypothetical protein
MFESFLVHNPNNQAVGLSCVGDAVDDSAKANTTQANPAR